MRIKRYEFECDGCGKTHVDKTTVADEIPVGWFELYGGELGHLGVFYGENSGSSPINILNRKVLHFCCPECSTKFLLDLIEKMFNKKLVNDLKNK